MLPPRDTATRERKSLDGLWRFALDTEGAGRRNGWWERPLAGAREIPVPSSYNDLFPEAEVHGHVGDVWYQATMRVPRGWSGERIILRFGSATHRAVVWVDGPRSPSTRAATRPSRPTSPNSWSRGRRSGSPSL
jgi:beta-glucuronidase